MEVGFILGVIIKLNTVLQCTPIYLICLTKIKIDNTDIDYLAYECLLYIWGQIYICYIKHIIPLTVSTE